MRGILERPIILHTTDDEVVVIPAGSQIEVISEEYWYHDISDTDIQEAAELLGEAL